MVETPLKLCNIPIPPFLGGPVNVKKVCKPKMFRPKLNWYN